MDEAVVVEAGFPIVEVSAGIVGGTMMFESTILYVALDEFAKGVDLFVLVEFELATLDLPLYARSPVLCLLLPFKVIADGGVAFDADDRTPDGSTVVVFAFEDRCHSANLLV